ALGDALEREYRPKIVARHEGVEFLVRDFRINRHRLDFRVPARLIPRPAVLGNAPSAKVSQEAWRAEGPTGRNTSMTAPASLWVAFTLIAATAQTFRNATQRSLTGTLGTAGATHIRFLFGLPFGLLFLAVVAIVY